MTPDDLLKVKTYFKKNGFITNNLTDLFPEEAMLLNKVISEKILSKTELSKRLLISYELFNRISEEYKRPLSFEETN